jgi:hypothetical protein
VRGLFLVRLVVALGCFPFFSSFDFALVFSETILDRFNILSTRKMSNDVFVPDIPSCSDTGAAKHGRDWLRADFWHV